MARPRKAAPADPLSDLSKKTEILEREMTAQRAAIERLMEFGKTRPQPLRAGVGFDPSTARRRVAR